MVSRSGLLGLAPALLLWASACGDSGDSKTTQDAAIDEPSGLDASLQAADAERPSADAAAEMDGGSQQAEAGRSGDAAPQAAPERDGAAGADDLDAQLGPADAAAVEDAFVRVDAQGEGSTDAASPAPAEDASTDDAGAADATTDSAEDASTGDPVVDDAAVNDAGTAPTCSAAQAPAVGRLGLRAVITDNALAGLTDAVQPPGSNDWYLVQQGGLVRVLRAGQSALESAPFLDLSAEIALLNADSYEDRGLVSIAFAPDYASSGRVYVSVTPDQGAFANVDLLLEYTRSSVDAYRVDPASRRTIVELRGRRLDSNFVTVNIHNGGRVAFGPDGMLYLAMGDGGGVNCGDVEPNATQDVSSLFGKMIRLDLTRPEPYAAVDNPFAGTGDARVWHYGLRNPFRFSFDRLTGDLYVGDVGQNRYEEIDFAPSGSSGLNFGWAPYEGNSRDTCPSRALREGSTHTAPIFVADRRAGAANPFADFNAMIGGVVYRGTALPQLYGAYLFGGYRSQRLGALYQCGSATSPVTPVLKRCNVNEPNAACLQRVDNGAAFTELRAIVEDHDGEIYMVANGNSLLKVVPAQ